jgi:hypothetical protein
VNGASDSQILSDAFKVFDRNRSVDASAIRAEAETALMQEPLNARALRVLGQLADVSNDNAGAVKFMEAAAGMSLHENIAVFWLMQKSTEAGDYKTAIAYADALMRSDPNLASYVVPVLAYFADGKAPIGAVEAVLGGDPPWRNLFFRLLPDRVSDPRTPLNLLLALKQSPTPPTDDDIRPYLNVLIQRKFYNLAYYTWLQFLPTDELRRAGLLFNGNFEVPPSGMPFDWAIEQGAGVTVDVVPRPDKHDQRALMVDFLYGRVDYRSVTELVLLTPGTYQFNAEYSGKIAGPRGLKWRVVCANDARTRVGESPMITGVTSGWKTTGFTFAIPAADCRAQYVRLDLDARMASEQLVSGSLLFSGVNISRVSGAPGASGTAAEPGSSTPTK